MKTTTKWCVFCAVVCNGEECIYERTVPARHRVKFATTSEIAFAGIVREDSAREAYEVFRAHFQVQPEKWEVLDENHKEAWRKSAEYTRVQALAMGDETFWSALTSQDTK